jgi:hypothetical protein
LWMLERGGMRSAIHVGGGEGRSARCKRIRVSVGAGERQFAGSSHHELRRAMTVSEEPIAGDGGRRNGVRLQCLGDPSKVSRKGTGDVQETTVCV